MKLDMTSGNFTLNISGSLSEEATAKLIESGFRYEVERKVLTETYKSLAGIPGAKGKLVLPPKYKRDSLPFNADNAGAFKSACEEAMAEFGAFTCYVSEYVKGETTESRKRATAMYEKSVAKGEDSLAKLASLADYDGDYDDSAAFIEAIHVYISDIES